MKKRIVALLLGLLLIACPALADWSSPTENLAGFDAQYAEQLEQYKQIKYGEKGAKVTQIKETLSELGYYANIVSDNYYRTLEVAVRVFARQMKIGDSGQLITPLMQAMLADKAAMPRVIVPGINVFTYSYNPNGNDYTAYTFSQLTRANAQQDAKVGFSGVLLSATKVGAAQYCAVQLENDAKRIVYVAYEPLPRTTVFQPGDTVAVFGVTQGEQTFTYDGMTEAAPFIRADRVGYAGSAK